MSEIKIFNEGDDILASDTNYNNRLLEDRINTHSDEVQNFMKDQYSALETKIDSAQATLQERINELNELICDPNLNGETRKALLEELKDLSRRKDK
jgi:hypothetical protein